LPPLLLALAVHCLFLLPGKTIAAEDASAILKSMSLEELSSIQVDTVVGASKHEQKVTEAPSSVTILTHDEIQKAGYRTLAEILNSVPGFYVRNDRNYSYLGIRGFSRPGDFDSSFLLMVDGHRVNDALTANASVDRGFAVDVDLIERVEVIRGPGASLYGDNAFFGVINVITRRGRDFGGGEVSGSGGSFGSYAERFSFGQQFSNGVELAVSGSYYQSAGNPRLFYPEFNNPTNNNGVASHQDSETAGSLFASAAWRAFTVEASYVRRTKQIPTGSYGTVFNDRRNQTQDNAAFVDLKFEHQFENDLNLQARLGYDFSSTLGTYIYDNGLPTLVANQDNFLTQRLTADLQLQRTFFDKHTVTAGAQLVDNLDEHQRNNDLNPPLVHLDDNHRGVNYGLYLQDEYRIFSNLIFNGGVRYDHFYTFGSSVHPRLALIYRPVEATSLKFLYGTAFRAPSPYELYYSDGGISQVPDPTLKPERIATYELVAEQQLGGHLTASASGFYYAIENLIQATALPPGNPNAGAIQLQNLGSANAKGLELALKGTWARGFEARASYSLTDARDGITGARLANSPLHLGKLDFTAPLYRQQIFANLGLELTGDRKTLAGQEAKGFGTVNITLLSRNLITGLEVSASVYNLFNTRYSDPGGPEHVQDLIPQDGRTFRAKLTYHF